MHLKLPPGVAWASLALAAVILAGAVQGAEPGPGGSNRFTGSLSCSSTSCHGGGTGRNEADIFIHKDKHMSAAGFLGKGLSQRIAEALQIAGDPRREERCNVCHAPLQGVPLDHLLKEAQEERTFACETCHGPAENWLLYHTRADITYAQSVAAGLRNLNDLYTRANTCVGCHANLDPKVEQAGHPPLNFELDGQTRAEPPHYKDARPSLGPRSWLTGQATVLREMSAKLAEAKQAHRAEPALVPRWRALLWLLRRTGPGRKELPPGEEYAAVQSAADQLARRAATALWTREELSALLGDYLSLGAEFKKAQGEAEEWRYRAQMLLPAIDSLRQAWQKESAAPVSGGFEEALTAAFTESRRDQDFNPASFAADLEHLRKELPLGAAAR